MSKENGNTSHIPRTVGFKAGERNVFFHILTACNLSCNHCYINHVQHGTKTLSKETIAAWLELFATPGKKSNLILLGGEPTMHPELPYIIKSGKELGFAVTVDSNGYLFHNLLDKTTPKFLDYLSFSLDGPNSSINDPIRGNGVFEECTANMRRAVDKGFCVSVIYTVSAKNIDYLHKMIPLLVDIGVKRFFIQVIGLRGESAKTRDELLINENETLQVSRAKWLSVVPPVAKMAAEAGIHVIYPKVFLKENENFECAGLVAENFFIFPNGRVYQCPLCEDHPIHTYQITENNLVLRQGLTEKNFFELSIVEGCVMNKLLQPETIEYDENGEPLHRISCCLLKQEIG